MTAPTDVVVGATDMAATAAMLTALDLELLDHGDVEGGLAARAYGLPEGTSWQRFGVPGRAAGGVRIVHTPHAGIARPAVAAGPLAVDVYTRDIDASLARVRSAGLDHGPVGTLDLGPLVMRQSVVWAPDGWRLVLVEANRRRPTVLDDDPDRLHSEVHSVLWTVPSIEETTAELEERGLAQAHVFPIEHPELARIIDLPTPDTTLVMNLLVDEVEAPIRVELCAFPGHPAAPAPSPGLRGGVHALAFSSSPTEPVLCAGGFRLEP